MSLDYSIAIGLNAKFSKENIKLILDRGNSLGFNYHKYIWGEINIDSPSLNQNDAISAIYQSAEEIHMHVITITYKDTYFDLHFISLDNDLRMMLPWLNPLWSKIYANGQEDIDVDRYIKLLLDIVYDYQIVDFRIYND